jgi:hypothetical protein
MNQAAKNNCQAALLVIGLLVGGYFFNLTVSTTDGVLITYIGIVIYIGWLHTKIYQQRLTIERLQKEAGAKAD